MALEIAAEIRAEWGYATDIIARAFRTHRELGSSDRRRISETVYALIRMDRRLDAIVDELLAARRGASDTVSPIARDELKLVVHELRGGVPAEAVRADVRRLVRGDLDLGLVSSEDAGLRGLTGMEREAVRLSYPTWLLAELARELGEAEATSLAAAMNERAPLAVRANTLLATRESLIDALAEEGVTARPGRWSPTAVVLETRVNVFGLSVFRRGWVEVMDEGSQLVAELVAPPPGGRVADACAGAGGKTLAIGAAMAGKGRLLALDIDGKKLEELRRRARRAGLTNVSAKPLGAARASGRASAAAARRSAFASPSAAPSSGGEASSPTGLPPEARLGGWDRVLVDAPCSGVGTLRRNPEARWRLTPQTVASFPARQLGLMVSFAPLVAVGGRLVYATCTVLPAENQAVIERFLAERDDFVRVPVKEIWGRARAESLQQRDDGDLHLYPHVHDTDGFYACVLRRVR